jgi:hypothetical protein
MGGKVTVIRNWIDGDEIKPIPDNPDFSPAIGKRPSFMA